MGEQNVEEQSGGDAQRQFTKKILDDLHALDELIKRGMIESGVRRIGAEQEMFLIDDMTLLASRSSTDILETAKDPRLTTELALFNLEANVGPWEYGGNCLSTLEEELVEVLGVCRDAAAKSGARVLLAGILPTLRRADLGLDSMTPVPRYYALNRAMRRMRGGNPFSVVIKGVDELEMTHDNVMLEACNTSFQVHFQVAADEFAKLYNLAQAITGPVLAAAVNSPVLLGRRLWHESRVALFQRSVDTRTAAHQARQAPARVSFGERWIEDSVLEIFREDIARFRVVLSTETDENPMEKIEAGEAPDLAALRLHNGTVYRWNRACYGISGGKPHLRIENRVLPSGPSVADEVANAALYFGLMSSLLDEYGPVHERMEFDHARRNFEQGARYGLGAQFVWFDGRDVSARELLRAELLPLARKGLASAGIVEADIDRYIGLVEQRVDSGQTGARWALSSIDAMKSAPTDTKQRALVTAMLEGQEAGTPGHEWKPADVEAVADVRESFLRVGQFMRTNPFTVHPSDLVDLAANLMDWERIRHIPVEDEEGYLVGILTHRALLRLIARGRSSDEAVAVGHIMKKDPVSVSPETLTLDALNLMRNEKVSAVPVVSDDGHLVGIVTDQDLIDVSARLLDAYLRGD
jgi:CBS domain-containing protein